MLSSVFTFACAVLVVVGWHSVCALDPRAHARRTTNVPPVHRLLRRAGNTTEAGITPLAISDDKQSYYAVLSAGGIFFRAALDTASADLWLSSSECETKTCKAVPRYPLFYNSPSFQTVSDNATAFDVSFLDGTAASGFVAREAISVANITVPDQAFGVVTESNVTMGSEVSGILGLGFPRLSNIAASTVNATPFMASLAQQGMLNYPIFSLSLTYNSSGSIAFGAVDSEIVTNASEVVWNEVAAFAPFGTERNTSGYLEWAIPLQGIAVNGTGITPKPTYPNGTYDFSLALLDIGTPGIYGPWQDVERIYAQIENARLVDQSGQWVVPCDIQENLAFTIGGYNFTLKPTDYLIGPASGNPNLCLSWPRASSPSSDGVDWQLGTAFLRTVYSIFSYGIDGKEPPMVGLFPLYNASAPVQSVAEVSAFLSSASATVATTLPNFLVSTPTLSTPAYTFNTSVRASVGEIVTSDLATSTYSAVLVTATAADGKGASSIPTIEISPSLQTFVVTDTAGHTSTSTSVAPSITLGVIPGRGAISAASRPHVIVLSSLSIFVLIAVTLLAWIL
ncbi:acid protease [Punctularia strigosozonata HHB-11173 SS5]|uniref:acid protease n=1 Tax=Punctularia strigosozonata (strain HHB-11173) TaxID=741275 RepID=UPI000441820D|nr:acid protease [Punctularia strigosozonata HHB-11173 SS5]EIN09682.1 acid protease [Punctularia strigosozonata HHB-11173 SS5]